MRAPPVSPLFVLSYLHFPSISLFFNYYSTHRVSRRTRVAAAAEALPSVGEGANATQLVGRSKGGGALWEAVTDGLQGVKGSGNDIMRGRPQGLGRGVDGRRTTTCVA